MSIFSKRNLDYVTLRVKGNLRSEANRTYLSLLWWVIEPTLLMVIYYFVFGIVLQRFTPDFIPFLLVGLILWQWFATSIANSATSITNQYGLMQRLYVPKLIFPAVSVLTDGVKALVVIAILLAFLAAYGFSLNSNWLLLPLILLAQFAMICGVAFVLAAITPFLPDLRIVLNNVLRVGLYVSGVLYPAQSVPERLQPYFYLNPMVGIIESFRNIVMYESLPRYGDLLAAMIIGGVLMLIGGAIIQRFDRRYPRLSIY